MPDKLLHIAQKDVSVFENARNRHKREILATMRRKPLYNAIPELCRLKSGLNHSVSLIQKTYRERKFGVFRPELWAGGGVGGAAPPFHQTHMEHSTSCMF